MAVIVEVEAVVAIAVIAVVVAVVIDNNVLDNLVYIFLNENNIFTYINIIFK